MARYLLSLRRAEVRVRSDRKVWIEILKLRRAEASLQKEYVRLKSANREAQASFVNSLRELNKRVGWLEQAI